VNTRATATTARELPAADNTSLIMPKGRRQKRFGHAVQSQKVEEISSISVVASILHLDHGLYVLTVAGRDSVVGEHTGIALPAVHISKPPSDQANGVEIIGSSGDPACWLDSKDGIVIVKAPLNGGPVLITSYRHRDEPSDACRVAVRRIDLSTPELTAIRNDKPALVSFRQRIKVEILLHMEGIGDRRMSADGWVGNRGRKLRIEAFGIYPVERLAPSDIEYRAFGPNGRETPWIGGGKLCGTRGRSLPLTGFAIRLVAPLRERFEIEYHGAFFESGLSGPFRDGEACMAGIDDDPLEAIDLHLFEVSDPSKFTSP
jgi:hypothetical protein